eukprot:TRINITY_DN55142_c0_g1_i2.p1 TRINITY_DN55142_c0_g1~~TRINITY_DN55142_c0_g1_i2.p1  ORF type:complete len:644 (-),score=315.81 TRINITY_DN55142_c0_g1_i2:132-2063(-)
MGLTSSSGARELPVRPVKIGWKSVAGVRPYNEDRAVLHPFDFDDKFPNLAMFGVFDGHNGEEASNWCADNFHKFISQHADVANGLTEKGMRDAFVAADLAFLDVAGQSGFSAGATAVVAVIDAAKKRVTVGNCGDAQCVLSRDGKAVPLYQAHKASDETERQRIEATGEHIVRKNRLDGVLAVSRSIGDLPFKLPADMGEDDDDDDADGGDGGDGESKKDTSKKRKRSSTSSSSNDNDEIKSYRNTPAEQWALSPVPHAVSVDLQQNDEFLVLGSDGLFDEMSDQQVIDWVRGELKKLHSTRSKAGQAVTDDDIQDLASRLVHKALDEEDSLDNITVVIVVFPRKEATDKDIEQTRLARERSAERERRRQQSHDDSLPQPIRPDLLPLPIPDSHQIRLVLFDMDLTVLACHTRGCYMGSMEAVSRYVTPTILHVVPRLLDAGIRVGIITFSDARMAEGTDGGTAGEALVTGALRAAFTRMWTHGDVGAGEEKLDATPEEINAKVDALMSQIYMACRYPSLHNRREKDKSKHVPNSKEWHINKVKDDVREKEKINIRNDQILFLDDTVRNTRAAALGMGVHSFLVTGERGLTATQWIAAIPMVRPNAASLKSRDPPHAAAEVDAEYSSSENASTDYDNSDKDGD